MVKDSGDCGFQVFCNDSWGKVVKKLFAHLPRYMRASELHDIITRTARRGSRSPYYEHDGLDNTTSSPGVVG